MASDTTQSEDPRDGTAAIPPVTDEMMEHAAHEAAALADGVAHHTIARDEPAAETPDVLAEPTHPSVAEPIADVTERTVDETETAAGEATEATTRIVDDVAAGADALAGAAREASSAAADALGQYNAKVLEMMRANAASTTALFAALVQAKSVPEAFSLNADHLRRQMETLTSQGRELTTLAQRIAIDAFQPLKNPTDR